MCKYANALILCHIQCFPEEPLFFAIPTKRNNGARYIPDLYERGVRNFVVTSEDFKGLTMDSEQLKVTMAQECNFLIVPNTLKALQKLAEQHRGSFQIPVVGITGSNGKTIVKEWLHQLFTAQLQFANRCPAVSLANERGIRTGHFRSRHFGNGRNASVTEYD